MNDTAGDEPVDAPLPPRKAERLVVDLWSDAISQTSPTRVLTTTLGRAQAAEFVARRHAEAAVVCSLLDGYATDVVRSAVASPPANLDVRCEADFAWTADVDAAAIPTTSQGEAELTRERLQAAYAALRPGGVLLTTTDNPRDTWLAEVVASLGGKVRRVPASDGVGYIVRRAELPPKRLREFTSEFAFRDGERLLHVTSRPGVFSHRRVDPGARRLLEAMQIADGDRVLDVGCGWGTVGLAAACRADNVTVVALDSNARAVGCTRRNAEKNGVAARLDARLEAYGRTDAPGSFDVAVANPPYYSQMAVAERFVEAARAALRPGGKLWIVTKGPDWYLERLSDKFTDVSAFESKGYAVVSALL
jgi:16S rRNA (guanine1207-N2)-methyltransferase